MIHVFGLPVYRLVTTFSSDGVLYPFDGIVNGSMFEHCVPTELILQFMKPYIANEND